jgi:hypothetical protein
MTGKNRRQRAWLKVISAVILLVGLSGAVVIYHRAGNGPQGVLDFENSKLYRHNLEVIGGKFSVIMDDASRWFFGLWQGKSLAFMIAGITLIISFGLFYAADHVSPRSKT